jgi:hypothetical protein
MDLYDSLHQVYEFVFEIPPIVFFGDIGDKIVDEILDILPR